MTTVPAVKKITVAHKTLEMRLTTEQLLFTPLNGYNTVDFDYISSTPMRQVKKQFSLNFLSRSPITFIYIYMHTHFIKTHNAIRHCISVSQLL